MHLSLTDMVGAFVIDCYN